MQKTGNGWFESAPATLLVLLAVAAPTSIGVAQSTLGLALLAGLLRWRSGGGPPRTGLEPYAGLLILWALLMIPFSDDRWQSLVFARRFYLLSAIWLYAGAIRTRPWRAAVLAALLGGGSAMGIYGIVQLWQRGGAEYAAGSGQLLGRVTLAQGYMTGGGIMMMVALVALAFLVVPLGRRGKALVMAGFLPVLASLVLTMTRSAWLGFCCGGVVVLALAGRRLLPLFAGMIVALALVMPGTYRSRLLSTFDLTHPHNQQRVVMWRTGLRMMLDHPLTGVGDRDLKAVYRTYHNDATVEVPGHLHNNPLMFAAIWGLPGLVLSLMYLLAIPLLLLGRWRSVQRSGARAPPLVRGWILAGLAGWTGFFVAGLFEWNFGDAEVALLLWILTGLGLARGRNEDRSATERAPSARQSV